MPKKLTQEKFIEKSKLKHGKKFDYSKVIYKNTRSTIFMICKLHGEFKTTPKNHLSCFNNCPKCAKKDLIELQTYSNEKFINLSNKKHNYKFDYSLTKYKNNKHTIIIICPYHGEFKQIANAHLRGHDCPKCAILNKGWGYQKWKKSGKESNNFESYKLYVIHVFNNTESFIKIGKTYTKLEKRFSGKTLPYDYNVLKIIEGDAIYISELEERCHKTFVKYKYKPLKSFYGNSECYIKI